MITGLDLSETVDYTLKDDTENPTIWKLGILSSYIYSRITGDENTQPLVTSFKTLQIGIKGWENFSSNGEEIKFTTKKESLFGRECDVLPLELLERIPMKALAELYNQILIINNLKDDERKNS